VYFDKARLSNISIPDEAKDTLQALIDGKEILLFQRPLRQEKENGLSIRKRRPTGFAFERKKESWFKRLHQRFKS
jgi:hypothetical protein